MQIRDMSTKKYLEAMDRHGFKTDGFMGYWSLPKPYDSTRVSDWNAGKRNRDKLAYMLRAWDREKQSNRKD